MLKSGIPDMIPEKTFLLKLFESIYKRNYFFLYKMYYKSGFEPGFPIVIPNTPNESLDTVVGLRYIVD